MRGEASLMQYLTLLIGTTFLALHSSLPASFSTTLQTRVYHNRTALARTGAPWLSRLPCPRQHGRGLRTRSSLLTAGGPPAIRITSQFTKEYCVAPSKAFRDPLHPVFCTIIGRLLRGAGVERGGIALNSSRSPHLLTSLASPPPALPLPRRPHAPFGLRASVCADSWWKRSAAPAASAAASSTEELARPSPIAPELAARLWALETAPLALKFVGPALAPVFVAASALGASLNCTYIGACEVVICSIRST